ncbi:MAG: hypothetical protein J6Y16_03150 [Treponema sp.]|nr:hypothetical protein [Treponema sp.]
MAVDLPNLFDYATSELSQDGFFAYFFKWAEKKYKNRDKALHNCAKAALEFIYKRSDKTLPKPIESIDIEKQWNYIDLLITINNNKEHKLVIEDKIDFGPHDNQLPKYKEILPDAIFVYLKTGEIKPEEKLEAIKYGYQIIDINDLSNIFDTCKSKNTIFKNFKDHIKTISLVGQLQYVFSQNTQNYKCDIYKNKCLYFWFNRKNNKSNDGSFLALDIWCSPNTLYFQLHCKGTGEDIDWMVDGNKVNRTIKRLTSFSDPENALQSYEFVFKENYYEYSYNYSSYNNARNEIEKKIDWIINSLK